MDNTISKDKWFMLISKVVLIFIMFFIIGIKDGLAFDNQSYKTCLNDGTCKDICTYTNDVNDGLLGGNDGKYTIRIIYYEKDNIWQIVSQKGDEILYSGYKKKSIPSGIVFIEYDVKIALVENGTCPSQGFADSSFVPGFNEICFANDSDYCKQKSDNNSFTTFEGTSTLTGQSSLPTKNTNNNSNNDTNTDDINIQPITPEKNDCKGILGDPNDAGKKYIDENDVEVTTPPSVAYQLQILFGIIKIITPILTIVFGSVRFGKAMLEDDENATKKASIDFIKSLIAAALLFVLPDLINFILSIAGGYDTCGIS